MLIRNMPLRRGGMHAKEVSRIWLTQIIVNPDSCLTTTRRLRTRVRPGSLLPVVLSPTR